MKNFLYKNWFGLLSVILSFSILASLVSSHGIKNFFAVIKKIQPKFFLIAFLLIILYCLLDSCILFFITRIKYKSYNFFSSIKTCLIGIFYSAITPMSIGGQPIQILDMTRKKIKCGDASSFVIIKMIVCQIGLVLYSLFSLLFYKKYSTKNFWFFVITGLILNIGFILLSILMSIKKDFVTRFCVSLLNFFAKTKFFQKKNLEETKQKITEQIKLFSDSAKFIGKQKRSLFILLFISFIQLTVYYLIPYYILKSFGIRSDLFLTVFATSLIYMITSFVPIPGASGANEGAFYIFFKALFSKSLAIPIIFVWRFITYYFLILIGGIIIIYDMIKKH